MYQLQLLIVFVTGAPAKFWDKTNPDYVPSINLPSSADTRRGNPVQKLQRFNRFRRRFGRVIKNDPVAGRGGKSPHPSEDIRTEAFARCQDEAEGGKGSLEDSSYLRTDHPYVPLPASQSEIFAMLFVYQVYCLCVCLSRNILFPYTRKCYISKI